MSGAQALPLAVACLWGIAAIVAGMLPSRDNRHARAVALMAVGVPVLGWITLALGPVAGVVLMAAGASVLRWPPLSATPRLWRHG